MMIVQDMSTQIKKETKHYIINTHVEALFYLIHTFSLQSEKKLWKASLLMLLIWTISWTPYALVFLASLTGHKHLITHHTDMIPGRISYNTS